MKCPFCGNESVTYREIERGEYHAACDVCGALGPATFSGTTQHPVRMALLLWRHGVDRAYAEYQKLYPAEEYAVDVDPDDFPLPEPDLPSAGDPLYHSQRGYLVQLQQYKSYRHNGGDHHEQ